uniref:Aminotransferase-like plant mobile domain-containing protein n=1 Tax=Fagus sylvatica TaxID=28930 RepID=A0A2N9EMJ3_FAGSY
MLYTLVRGRSPNSGKCIPDHVLRVFGYSGLQLGQKRLGQTSVKLGQPWSNLVNFREMCPGPSSWGYFDMGYDSAPVAFSHVPGGATLVAPSSVSDEADDLREGFVFPLIDPWYESSPLFPPRSFDFFFPAKDWDWTVSGLEPVSIDFDFPCAASKDWSHWVDLEILDLDFWDSLRDAGVHWSILISRSCNMFRDTEPLREVLKRWCPSTHTFFFSWGELTPTLEDVTNHWMLPILGEHSFSSIELFAEEEEIAAALRRQSSTRLSGWPSHFMHRKEAPVRRATFVLYWLFYCWVSLKTHDHDLVTTLDYEENVLLRPYCDDYPGFTCASVFSRSYQPTSSIHDLRADGYRSLSYLSTRQFGFDQGVPVGPQEIATYISDLTPFIKSRAFARWKGEVSRIMVPSGHRFGFNTLSMGAYWQRLTQSMVEFVNAGRSEKTPISIHRKPLISYPCLSPPSQFAISYANNQRLGFAEWDEVKGGWIVYTIHLPQSWRSSVTVVEDCLIMPSKRGKGSKKDAPMDQAVEKAPKKPAPSPKTPPKKTKAGKKGKSTTSASASKKKSTTAPVEKPTDSTVAPSKTKSPVPLLPLRMRNNHPRLRLLHPPKKKKFVAPLFPLGAASRTRSKSGSKATHGLGRSSGGVVIVEDSDMVVDDVVTSSLGGDDLQTAAVDKDLEKSVADGSEAGSESTEGGHPSPSDSFFDTAPGSVPEEQIMSAESTIGDDDMPGADDSNIGSAGLISHDLAIVPHASHSFGHGRDDGGAADSEVVPLSFSVPQTVLTSGATGFDTSMTYIMEGISLFGATPRLSAIPTGDFVISTSRITGEAPLVVGSPIAGEVPMPKEVHAQDFIESESAVDLGVTTGISGNVDNAVDHGTQAEGNSASMADVPADSEHLDNIGTGEAVRLPEEDENMGITGEVTVASPPPGPTAVVDSNIGVGSMSKEVADFFKEFDKRTPNPHPKWHFWKFNGLLVSYGDFWVPSDSVPYLQQLTIRHGDFITKFKLGAGLGGPMLSLLSSVLAAMSKSDLGSVTKVQILAWRSVVQELMEVGFDIGFMLGHLRRIAQHLFGRKTLDEIQVLQHQIALLQDSLAVLTAYHEEIVSTGVTAPEFERGGSLFDSLIH